MLDRYLIILFGSFFLTSIPNFTGFSQSKRLLSLLGRNLSFFQRPRSSSWILQLCDPQVPDESASNSLETRVSTLLHAKRLIASPAARLTS